VRKHPVTGVLHRSVLKPIGTTFYNKTVDFHSVKCQKSIEPSSGDDIDNTVAVMGGEDWKMWMDALKAENLLLQVQQLLLILI
jgi:enoyl-[acyl-carrier protein] reductase/trans-2-enoyl-CoA reductase (NAD+)